MSSPALGLKTCTLKVNLFSGARTALPAKANALLTIRDGNQDNVVLPNNGFVKTSSVSIGNLPFFDNFGDQYAVVASADKYRQAGFYPVTLNPLTPAVVDIMLLGRNATFNFKNAIWRRLLVNFPAYAALLGAGAASADAAGKRYSDVMENSPDSLACLFNLLTAMSQIQLPVKTPLDYFKQIFWDDTLAQDRFFAWADVALIDQIVLATAHGQFSPEAGTAAFHPGATRSWKQLQFGEANIQLTFHEGETATIDGVSCVKVEPDIDYYKDLLAHALLEVITNKVTNTLTDPRQVYVLRWIAGRHAGVPNFEPPYTIE